MNWSSSSKNIENESILGKLYPIGTIYQNGFSTASPTSLLGFGVWDPYAPGRVNVGLSSTGTFNTLGSTGGAETHTLTTSQIASHSHAMNWEQSGSGGPQVNPQFMSGIASNANGPQGKVTETTGGGEALNNIQPYVVTSTWIRTG